MTSKSIEKRLAVQRGGALHHPNCIRVDGDWICVAGCRATEDPDHAYTPSSPMTLERMRALWDNPQSATAYDVRDLIVELRSASKLRPSK